jgi:hypothetical protein
MDPLHSPALRRSHVQSGVVSGRLVAHGSLLHFRSTPDDSRFKPQPVECISNEQQIRKRIFFSPKSLISKWPEIKKEEFSGRLRTCFARIARLPGAVRPSFDVAQDPCLPPACSSLAGAGLIACAGLNGVIAPCPAGLSMPRRRRADATVLPTAVCASHVCRAAINVPGFASVSASVRVCRCGYGHPLLAQPPATSDPPTLRWRFRWSTSQDSLRPTARRRRGRWPDCGDASY